MNIGQIWIIRRVEGAWEYLVGRNEPVSAPVGEGDFKHLWDRNIGNTIQAAMIIGVYVHDPELSCDLLKHAVGWPSANKTSTPRGVFFREPITFSC